jgi:hypothetical protein
MYFVPSETVEEQWKEIKEANLTNLAGDFWPVSNTPCVTERERERRRRRAGVGRAVASPAFPRREASAALPPPLVRTPSRRREQGIVPLHFRIPHERFDRLGLRLRLIDND